MLEQIIEKLDKVPDMSTYSTEEKEFSVRLFSISVSYLKGKCVSLAKSYSSERDGFKLWRALRQEYHPNTRGARSFFISSVCKGQDRHGEHSCI